jgi:hypothetical protein
MKRVLAACIVFLVSCGPFSPQGPLQEAATKLGEVRSGTLVLRVSARTRAGDETGFHLSGPFSFPEDESLPEAQITYRRVGSDVAPLVFTSTGDHAYLRVDGQNYQLPPEQVSSLRGASEPDDVGPFDALKMDEWLLDAAEQDGPRLDGVDTRLIRGDVDVVAAANDLFAMARDFGGSDLPAIEGEEAQRLRRAVTAAHLQAAVGKSDGYVRRLRIAVNLSEEAPERLAPQLEELLGVRFALELRISEPNQPIKVQAPPDVQPYESLVG